jgi:transcriptional regulator with XRE-family HTH domain
MSQTEINLQSAGRQLRMLREQLGLTIRDVETAAAELAARHGSEEFAIPLSRLSDIETKGMIPSIYRVYSLAAIYRRDYRELLRWYGINLDHASADIDLLPLLGTHTASAMSAAMTVQMPVRLDPVFDLRRTTNIGRMIEAWGVVPMALLSKLDTDRYTYGYIGLEDYTMYPLLMPGSFVQVDESKNQVSEYVGSRSEYEKPIYLVETRKFFVCAWCELKKDTLVIQPHPLSPTRIRIFKYPSEAEVVGQVVGIAMRLGNVSQQTPIAGRSFAQS